MKDDSKGAKYHRKGVMKGPLEPSEIIHDTLEVPDNTILVIPDDPLFTNPEHFSKAGKTRSWFTPFFYHCLPLVFGNQHGFLMHATYDFVLRWDGSPELDGVKIHILEPLEGPKVVDLDSHFGSGILTVQSRYVYRTPPGVNLIVKEPPNFPIHGLSWMTAVVETDNLRRDFTFNIKITQPHLDIYIPKGTPLGCLLPYPRYFLDDYRMEELADPHELRRAEQAIRDFAFERDKHDAGQPRHRYMEGIDIYNLKFGHHQKSLDGGAWWFSENPAAKPATAESKPACPWTKVVNFFQGLIGSAPQPDSSEKPRSQCVWKPGGSVGSSKEPAATLDNAFAADGINASRWIDKETAAEILELNADLPEAAITLYLPPNYDKSLLPIKADKGRQWWERDRKTIDHARFCLPLTMASGVGWYILSPATFTVLWDGDPDHDAEIEILDAAPHAVIDNHSACGAFTIQTGFVPRTKRPGDFVYIKGVSNQERLPYQFLDAMVEAWWSPGNFGLVALLNQAGKFTIQKGEPIAQMFAINVEQATYEIAQKEGYPYQWKEWDEKRRDPTYTGRNMDYLRGLWPDETAVCPHFKSWSPKDLMVKQQAPVERKPSKDSIKTTHETLSRGNYIEGQRLYERHIQPLSSSDGVTDLMAECSYLLGSYLTRQNEFTKAALILNQGIDFCSKLESPAFNLVANLNDSLGYAERLQSNFKAAEACFQRALALRRENADSPAAIATSAFSLGALYDVQLRCDEAEPLILESVAIRRRELGEKHRDTLFSRNVLACMYVHQKRYQEAESLYWEVADLREKTFGKNSLDAADSQFCVAFLYRETNNYQRAKECFERALVIRQRVLGDQHRDVLLALEALGYLERDQKNYLQAKEYFEKALAIADALPANSSSKVASLCLDLGWIHQEMGDKEQSEAYFKRNRSLVSAAGGKG